MNTINSSLLTVMAACLSIPSFAQTREDKTQQIRTAANAEESDRSRKLRGALEEIVVTAQRREERLQDVPISISVMEGALLDRSTAQDVTEALKSVPGIAISQSAEGNASQVIVRGVSAAGGMYTGSSTTGYYLDWVPFAFIRSAVGPDLSAYDLDRVEVLRGPQGTLYGANSLNGVVRVLSRDAKLDAFELKARSSVSTTDSGDENYRGDMAVNVPIINEKLAARAVLGYQNLGGWIDKPNDRNANDGEVSTVRLKINAKPTDQLSIVLSGWLSQSDYDAPSQGDATDRNETTLGEPVSTDYNVYGLKVEYEFSWFSVTSMTGYLDYENQHVLDLNPQPGILRFDASIWSSAFSEEIVLNSTTRGAWRWSLGAIYRDDEYRHSQLITPLYLAPSDVEHFSDSYAVFGELTRRLFDARLELTAGLRHFEDDVTMSERSRSNGVPLQPVRRDAKFDATTPRLAVTWHPNEEHTVYVSYGEGFRSGLHQTPAVLIAAPLLPQAEPDNLKNYEIGAKGSLLDGRLGFDAAIYYMDWQDVQQRIAVLFDGAFRTAFVNGESASGLGVDLGVTAQPIDSVQIGLSASWNNLAADSDIASGGVALFDKGDRLGFSPEYTADASVDYIHPIGKFEGRFSTSANFVSKTTSQSIVAGARSVGESDAMVIARAGFSIAAPKNWTATLFIDNVTDERGFPNPVSGANPNLNTRVRPRTVGAQFEYRY